jgi:hypothetical protein
MDLEFHLPVAHTSDSKNITATELNPALKNRNPRAERKGLELYLGCGSFYRLRTGLQRSEDHRRG